jgi:hypothetical protein
MLGILPKMSSFQQNCFVNVQKLIFSTLITHLIWFLDGGREAGRQARGKVSFWGLSEFSFFCFFFLFLFLFLLLFLSQICDLFTRGSLLLISLSKQT